MTASLDVPSFEITPEILADLDRGDWSLPLTGLIGRAFEDAAWRDYGLALLAGVPVDSVELATELAAQLSRAVGVLLPQDGNGTLVRQVRYRGIGTGEGATGRYSDSNEGGQLHTDGPHRPQDPPDLFALLCVRQSSHGGALVVVRHQDVARRLSEQTLDQLSADFAFDQREVGVPAIQRPVLTRAADGSPRFRYLRSYIDKGEASVGRSAATERIAALDALDAAIEDAHRADSVSLVLAPGQLIFVDNRRLLHGRTAFTVDQAGLDRIMLRTWIGLAA